MRPNVGYRSIGEQLLASVMRFSANSGSDAAGVWRTLDSNPASAHGPVLAHAPFGGKMERFVHQQNLEHYRRLLAEIDVTKDRVRHAELLKLLAAEVAKDAKPPPARI